MFIVVTRHLNGVNQQMRLLFAQQCPGGRKKTTHATPHVRTCAETRAPSIQRAVFSRVPERLLLSEVERQPAGEIGDILGLVGHQKSGKREACPISRLLGVV